MKIFATFLVLVSVFFTTAFTTNTPTPYKIGDTATDFKLKSVDGKMYSMADYKDAKGFIVVFTCNHCPFAVKYENRINALAKKYKSKGYILLAINPNDPTVQPEDSYEFMKVKAKEKGFYLMKVKKSTHNMVLPKRLTSFY